ncbi:hypothetical protein XPA_009634 [Xanthoria parietina]
MISSPTWLLLQRPTASSKLSPQALISCQHSDMTRKITITSSMMPVQAAVAQIASRLLPIIFALYQPHFVFSAACNNTFGSMFESLPTLHNCFTFGSVIAGDFPNLGASQIAAKLHYLDDESNATANHVAWVLEGCLSKYCDTVPNCKESLRLQTLTKIHDGFDKSKYSAYKICENIPSTINSDAGGIGVYISYWIKIGLAILGFVGTLVWKWIIPNIHFYYQAFQYGWSEAETRSQHLNKVSQEHLTHLVAALTDFRKAQCFFMLSINITVLVVIQRGGFDPQSLQQTYGTYVFLLVLAANGFLPTTFTLTNLYLVGMLSWFLILLSTVTVVLSIATLASVGRLNPSEADMRNLKTLAASGGPPECDFFQPGIYCLSAGEFSYWDLFYGDQDTPISTYRILGFCLTNLALLVGSRLHIEDLAVVKSAHSQLTSLVSAWVKLRRLAGNTRRAFSQIPAEYRVSIGPVSNSQLVPPN